MNLETIEKIVGLAGVVAGAGWWAYRQAYNWRNKGTKESPEFRKLQKEFFVLKQELVEVKLALKNSQEDKSEILKRLEKIEDKYTELIKDMFKYFQIK